MDDFFLIARVVSVSVRDGFLKLKLFTDHPEKLYSTEYIFVDFWGSKKKFLVEEILKRGESILLKLKIFQQKENYRLLLAEIFF